MNATATMRRTVRCPTCGHAVPAAGRGQLYCPHCGRQLRRGPAGRAAAVVVCVAFVAIGTAWLRVTSIVQTNLRVSPPPPAKVDPVDGMLNDAQVARVTWAVDLDHRADAVRAARQALVDQVADLANLSARVTAAVTRATDEDRWPARVAGRSLGRADADALLGRIADAAAADRRAVARDGAVVDALVAAAAAARAESGRLGFLRHDWASHRLSTAKRADIERQAVAFQEGSAHPPTALTLSADPARPVDLDALLR